MEEEIFPIEKWEIYGGGKHRAIKFIYSREDLEKNDFIRKAKVLSKKVDDRDPSGIPRPPQLKFCRALCGLIAEHASRLAIKEEAKKKKKDVEVYIKKFRTALDQVDLTIKKDKRDFNVEVRSSGHFKQNLEEVHNRDFSIIGWYITEAKGKEIKKDFYILVLFPFKEEQIKEKIDTGICLFVAGGATKELLESKGSNRNLKQYGAVYRTIYPIAKGFDGASIISKIVSDP